MMNDGPRAQAHLRILKQTIGFFQSQRTFTPSEIQLQWPHKSKPSLREISCRLSYYKRNLKIKHIGQNVWGFV